MLPLRLAHIHQPVVEIIIVLIKFSLVFKFLIVQVQCPLREFLPGVIIVEKQMNLLMFLHLWQALFKERSRI